MVGVFGREGEVFLMYGECGEGMGGKEKGFLCSG